MNRQEAVQVINQVLGKCFFLDGYYFALMPPANLKKSPDHYEVHMRLNKNQIYINEKEALDCIRDIVKQNNLNFRMENDLLIIYRP